MIYNDDCLNMMKQLSLSSVDMIFADPPYFLSNGGITIRSGKISSVDKGEWDKKANITDVRKFTSEWICLCHRLLKRNGTIWISSTHHNLMEINHALLECGFYFINSIVWHKQDPPPLAYKTRFRFSYETILWYGKSRHHYFDYQAMYDLEQKEKDDVWTLPSVSKAEKQFGYHPTQKPECLLEIIIQASTRKHELVLDPFMGSGTTCVVAKKLSREYIGIEKEKEYFLIAQKRLQQANE